MTTYGSYVEERLTSGAKTAAGTAEGTEPYGDKRSLRVQLNVTSATGTTPSLSVFLEDSVDGGSNWNVLHTFTAVATSPNRQVANITTPFGRKVRARWDVTGTTPSFTFTVDVGATP